MRRLLLVLALLFVGIGCEAPKDEENTGEAKKERGEEDRSARIEIRYNYPADQAHKSRLYELTKFGDLYEFNGYETNLAPITALLGSVTDLVPSDSMKTCQATPTKPTFSISLPVEGGRAELTSTSQCLEWAPWNVVKDGKLYTQLNGNIGKALYPLLMDIAPAEWEKDTRPKAGVIDLAGGEKAAEGITAQAAATEAWLPKVNDNPAIKAAFGDHKVSKLLLKCNQGVDPNCKAVAGGAEIELEKGFFMRFPVEIDETGVASGFTLPKDMSKVNVFMKSKLATALAELADNGIVVNHLAQGPCDAVVAAAPKYTAAGTDAATLSCEQFAFVAQPFETDVIPPSLVFFPSLDAAWIANVTEDTDMTFFDNLTVSPEVKASMEAGGAELFSNGAGEVVVLAAPE